MKDSVPNCSWFMIVAVFILVLVLSVSVALAQSQTNCYLDDRYGPNNDWNGIKNCKKARAELAVALMLLGWDKHAASLASIAFKPGASHWSEINGRKYRSDSIGFSIDLNIDLNEIKKVCDSADCYDGWQFDPYTGKRFSKREREILQTDGPEALWGAADVPYPENAAAKKQGEANSKKIDRITAIADRAAMKKCESIASQLKQLTSLEKDCVSIAK